MQRFPDGIAQSGFYQKEVPDYFPDWITRADVLVQKSGETQQQVICDKEATLIYLANQACITPHIWLSSLDNQKSARSLEHPDRLIFDLDPPGGGGSFELVRKAARLTKELLLEVGLNPYLMLTGSRGIHVTVPLSGQETFDAVRHFARSLSELLAHRHQKQLTIETRKEKRNGKLFVDYLRNAYGQTSVAPYAVRGLPGAPVATPIEWEELARSDLRSQSYSIGSIFRRLGQKNDPWEGMDRKANSLEDPSVKLQELRENAGI